MKYFKWLLMAILIIVYMIIVQLAFNLMNYPSNLSLITGLLILIVSTGLFILAAKKIITRKKSKYEYHDFEEYKDTDNS